MKPLHGSRNGQKRENCWRSKNRSTAEIGRGQDEHNCSGEDSLQDGVQILFVFINILCCDWLKIHKLFVYNKNKKDY